MTQHLEDQPPTPQPPDRADIELKARHRSLWASGDYPKVASEVIPTLGADLVHACGVGADHRVLDVAAGAGNAAIPAALAGADVTASDLTPELLSAGRLEAERRGARLTWEEADAEALPFAEDSFDVVLSCVGVMFAPHHQPVADEMVRVSAPGGTIGMINWTPEGFIGQLLAVLKPFAPPPPAGVQPPILWGKPDHVAALLGDRVSDLATARRTVRVDRFGAPAELREFFKAHYGPVLSIYRHLAADTDAVVALDGALDELARRHQDADGVMEWEYLLVTARVR